MLHVYMLQKAVHTFSSHFTAGILNAYRTSGQVLGAKGDSNLERNTCLNMSGAV
jgi:hypothetical protein